MRITPLVVGITLLVVALLPVPADAAVDPRASAYQALSKRKIDLDFHNAEVRHVLRLLAENENINIVLGDDVQGKVTMRLRQVQWRDAFVAVLDARGLDFRQRGNILRVAPRAVLYDEDRAALDRDRECEERGSIETRVVTLSHARAKELAPIAESMLTKRGSVAVDERTNTLIIRDVACSSAMRRF